MIKDIKGYEGLYAITDDGRVWSYPKTIGDFGGHNGMWLKFNKMNTGYLCVHLHKNGKRKLWKIHRLVALAFIPNPENKPLVNHIDGVKTNNYVSNLEWATRIEDTRHAWKMGLCERTREVNRRRMKILGPEWGKRWGAIGGRKSRVLTMEQAEKIRELFQNGNYDKRQLTKIYNVSRNVIHRIITRQRYND